MGTPLLYAGHSITRCGTVSGWEPVEDHSSGASDPDGAPRAAPSEEHPGELADERAGEGDDEGMGAMTERGPARDAQ